MTKKVNVNIQTIRNHLFLIFVAFTFVVSLTFGTFAQKDQKQTRLLPFEELLRRDVKMRPELKNVHPRLFFGSSDIPIMRDRAKNADRDLWQETLKAVKTLDRQVPDVSDEDLYKSGLDKRKPGVVSQYEFAFQISQTTFAYVIEGDERYLAAAKKWALAACDMPIWGYTYNKPNVDLPPAHLLYAVSFAYDVLFDKLTNSEKETIRKKLIKQARLMYEYFNYKQGKRYSYSQNHTWIPMAGLAVAAYVLIDETDEVKNWARLARAVFDRTMLTFSADGYFYESFHYVGFAFRWMIRYFDVHKQITGENLYEPMKPKFDQMKNFVMHSILPDRENIFDFADIGDGSLNRNKISKRERLYGEYDILYRFAAVYQDSKAQKIADFIRTETELGTREPMWAFINHDPSLKPAALTEISTVAYFADNGTVFWRSDWSKNATAFAFRNSPPEGHFAARLASKIADWRQSTGHAHPDANSFIIYSKGKYLTGDTGYLGIKRTDDHNTILVNGRGQAGDGVYDMFKEVPNEKLDKINIVEIWGTNSYFYVRGEAASAYYDDLGLKKFNRHFLYVAPDYFVVWDELETEKPSNFTFMLNADRDINLEGKDAFLVNEHVALRVASATSNGVESVVVPQMIQARGLPGSVSDGDAEQRGIQLQTTSKEKLAKFEFLHLLQPFMTAEKAALPKVLAFTDNSKGLRLNWPNGNTEFVFLTGKGTDLDSDARRLVIGKDGSDEWNKLFFQNAKFVVFENKTILRSGASVSATLQYSKPGTVSGWIMSDAVSQIVLRQAKPPKSLRSNGENIEFTYIAADKSLNFNLKAGRNFIEIE